MRDILQPTLIQHTKEEVVMNRIALIGIIVEDTARSAEINSLLHEYGEFIIGRMGVPYRERKVSVISVMLDAPGDVINSLSGKLGMLEGVSVKTVYSKGEFPTEKKDE
ncbi:MAG: iron-only hydrogenase system regulator [Lentisphaerae bacterium]|nr:iron-only hydrogenase system regulator [Lentisphaerota bacterium]